MNSRMAAPEVAGGIINTVNVLTSIQRNRKVQTGKHLFSFCNKSIR